MKKGLLPVFGVKRVLAFWAVFWLLAIALVLVVIGSFSARIFQGDMEETILEQAREMRTLIDAGEVTPEAILLLWRNNEIVPAIVTDPAEIANLPKVDLETAERLIDRAERGEVVLENSRQIPFCLLKIGDNLFLLSYHLESNRIYFFLKGVQLSILCVSILGCIIIMFSSMDMLRRIKRISAATKEVAKGNFDIQLDERPKDEMGRFYQDFNRMVEALQQNEFLHKDFISSVSHEFKTPITSIKGFAKMIRTGDLSKEQFEEYTDVIIKEADRLSNLSANILRLSELDNKVIQSSMTTFSLDEHIRAAILLMERDWSAKDLQLEIELQKVEITGDEDLLSQVWINLLSNAIKFSPQGGTVQIRTSKAPPYVYIRIMDQGIGIEEEALPRVFERFYQADSSHGVEGNGLGLAIVKKIVELYGGSVKVASKVGEGTNFTVKLPLSQGDEI